MHATQGTFGLSNTRVWGISSPKSTTRAFQLNTVHAFSECWTHWDASKEAEDMDLPGYKFHSMKVDPKSEFAVTMTENRRITLEFIDEDAVKGNQQDYH